MEKTKNAEIRQKVEELCDEFEKKFNSYSRSLGEKADKEMGYVLIAQDLEGTHVYGAGTQAVLTQAMANALQEQNIRKPLILACEFLLDKTSEEASE